MMAPGITVGVSHTGHVQAVNKNVYGQCLKFRERYGVLSVVPVSH